jgi:hypothetical protein
MNTFQTISESDRSRYFTTNSRMLVGAADVSIAAIPPAEAIKSFDEWVRALLEALKLLHDADLIHGGIDVGSLRIGAEGQARLRIAGQTLRTTGDPMPRQSFDVHVLSAAPEQLLWNGKSQGLPFSTMYAALMRENFAIDRIGSMFPTLRYGRPCLFATYELMEMSPPDGAATDVWMLANALMMVYSEILTWGFVISSDFYQTKHEQFMDLLEHMLECDPRKRWTVDQLLEAWKHDGRADAAAATPVAPIVAESAAAAESPASETAAPVETDARRRPLDLSALHGPSGRNRTRKNLRNSNRNLANGNLGLPAQG